MSSLDTISHHLGPAILVIARVGGVAVFGPVLGSSAVPMKVKALLIATLGAATYPVVAAHAQGPEIPLSLGTIGPLVLVEAFVGVLVGLLAVMPLAALQMGGLVMGQQMGLGFARIYNPAFDDEGDSIEQILFFLGLAAFLGIGGLEQMTLGVLRSFEYVGIGGGGAVVAVGEYGIDNALLRLLAGVMLSALELAIRVAAPVLCVLLLESVAIGFLSRSVPALNLLSLGFPLRILLGLSVLILGMNAIRESVICATADAMDMIRSCFVVEGVA